MKRNKVSRYCVTYPILTVFLGAALGACHSVIPLAGEPMPTTEPSIKDAQTFERGRFLLIIAGDEKALGSITEADWKELDKVLDPELPHEKLISRATEQLRASTKQDLRVLTVELDAYELAGDVIEPSFDDLLDGNMVMPEE